MTTITQSGHVAIAQSIAGRPLHLAWGTGDKAWFTAPAEDKAATTLKNELGRRKATSVSYVVPDDAGPITDGVERFSVSKMPTNRLLVKTVFDFDDAPSAEIREIAVFVGSKMANGSPKGQRYFEKSEVAESGLMLHLQNVVPIFRSPAIRENFEVIIAF